MSNYTMQALGQYKQAEVASALKERDHKDATDLIIEGGGYGEMEGVDLYNQTTTGEVAKTLNSRATDSDHVPCVAEAPLIEMTSTKNTVVTDGTCPTLTSRMGTGGNQVNAVMETFRKTAHPQAGGTQNWTTTTTTDTLNAFDNTEARTPTLITETPRYVVRRLTPEECELLQGYPIFWTLIGEPDEDGVYWYTDTKGKRRKVTDSARYKALGNSIGLPPWKWVLKRISAQYERDATLGSLFDGIGGFPHLWEQINGKGSCLWASEIEEFCIAVTEWRINGYGKTGD